MHRTIARVLLVLMLVGTFVPIGLAMTAPATHACCLRKAHGGHSEAPQVNALETGNGKCCPPLATANWSKASAPVVVQRISATATLAIADGCLVHSVEFNALLSARAPPAV